MKIIMQYFYRNLWELLIDCTVFTLFIEVGLYDSRRASRIIPIVMRIHIVMHILKWDHMIIVRNKILRPHENDN